jgi:iron complex transport system substrate-binding protein
MDKRFHRIALTAGLLTTAVLIVVALSSFLGQRSGGTGGRTVVDLAGRTVAVPGNVERLIALGPGALRLVTYLGAADRIVGIEDFEKRMARDLYVRPYASVLDESFFQLPVVGTGGPGVLPDSETLLLCRPDLIVAVNMDPAQLDNIHARTGVPVVGLSYGELGVWRDEARQSLTLLGKVLGKSERASAINQYVASLEGELKQRTAHLNEEDSPSAYFGGISYKGAQGLTSTEAGYPPARLAGVGNLADGLGKTGHFLIDKEQILVWNPEFIFVDTGSRPILDADFENNRGFYRLLKAVNTGRVFSVLPYNYYNTNIELALINAYFVGKSVYPDRFDDVNMEDKAGEIMATFLGVRPDQEIPAYRSLRFPQTGPLDW